MTKKISEVLSLEAIKEAYKKCSYTPKMGDWFFNGCACPATAVAIANGLNPEVISEFNFSPRISVAMIIGKHLCLDANELLDFIDGVDFGANSITLTKPITDAFKHGCQIREALEFKDED